VPKSVVVAGAYALMCAIWGTTWLAIKVSLHYVPPMTGVGLRFIIAGLIMFGAAFAARKAAAPNWKLVLVLAVTLFGLNYVLNYVSETHIASGLTAVLFGTLPFFTFIFGHYMLEERTTARMWAGAVLAFAGVALISLAGGAGGSLWYALAAIGAACSASFANVYAKRHAHNEPLVTLPPAMLIAGTGVFLLGLFFEHPNLAHAAEPQSVALLLYMAVGGSALTFFINLWLLQRITAGLVSLSALIIPVIAVFVGVFAGGEAFGARDIMGGALVLGGVWYALGARS
jgi:drug/metabolite transporter (DMT)-like permease